MASSSDEEGMLGDLFRRHEKPVEQNSQDSGLPDWIKTNTPKKASPIAVDSDEDSDAAAGPSSKPQPTHGAGPSNAASKEQQAAATAAAAAGGQSIVSAVGGASDRVVVLPERLIRNKVLVELEPAPHQATELSGDAGAVGRLVASSSTAADGCFKIDLKGVLYQATVHPLAGTAIVINMGPTEAKIESVMNDFVRLKEEQSYVGMTTLEGSYGMEDLMADDEDNYQVGAAGDDVKDEKGAKKAAAKRSKAGSSKAATASKALKASKAGVKKKAATKKSAGKGRKASSTAKRKGGASKSAQDSAVKAPRSSSAKAATGGKPKSAKKPKQKADSDDEDEGDWDSDWSGE